MKRAMFLFLMIFSLRLLPEKVGEIVDLFKYSRLALDSDHLYIVSESTPLIHVYSLKDCKPIAQFGNTGPGPGEFEFVRYLDVYKDFLLLEGQGKLAYFSKDGIFQKEIKISDNYSNNYKLVGNNYVCTLYQFNQKTKSYAQTIVIQDSKFKEIKELARKENALNLTKLKAAKIDEDLFPDQLQYEVWQDRIYVGDTRKGYYIAVYDRMGKLLYEIKKPFEKLKVTSEDVQKRLDRLKYWYGNAAWKQIKQSTNYIFPEYFPVYADFRVVEDRIYVRTSNRKGELRETQALDLQGKTLKSAFLPGGYWGYYSRGIYYYLKDDNESDSWELHAEKIL